MRPGAISEPLRCLKPERDLCIPLTPSVQSRRTRGEEQSKHGVFSSLSLFISYGCSRFRRRYPHSLDFLLYRPFLSNTDSPSPLFSRLSSPTRNVERTTGRSACSPPSKAKKKKNPQEKKTRKKYIIENRNGFFHFSAGKSKGGALHLNTLVG